MFKNSTEAVKSTETDRKAVESARITVVTSAVFTTCF
jgi:hypothetical protein